nr:hypothetical protein [Tanacetum cinerariifolium]
MKLFKSLSLDESRSHVFDLFSNLEENSDEEVAETMAETMDESMSKTRADYGSGITRPKINDKDHFKHKGQFLKELRDNTFNGSDHEDANGHIEKVLEIVDLFHIPNITQDKIMLRAVPMSLTRAASHWLRHKPSAWERFKELLMKCPQHYLTEIQEVILFYNGLEVLTRQILDSKGAIPTKTAADANIAIQEMARYSQKWHNRTPRARNTETSDGLAVIQAQLNNLGREIKKVNEKERGFGSFPNSTETNLRDHVKSISTNVEADMTSIRIKSSQYAVSAKHNRTSVSVMPLSIYLNLGISKFVFLVDFIILDMLKDVEVSLILGRPFLSTGHAKIGVFKRKITLRVGDEKIIFKSVKPASRLIKRVYMLSLKERMELDLEATLMGETLVLNRSLDPLYGDHIELNDLNVPLQLRRDQVDDLMPTIEEGEVVDKPMIDDVKTRDDDKMVAKFLDTLMIMTMMRRFILIMPTT